MTRQYSTPDRPQRHTWRLMGIDQLYRAAMALDVSQLMNRPAVVPARANYVRPPKPRIQYRPKPEPDVTPDSLGDRAADRERMDRHEEIARGLPSGSLTTRWQQQGREEAMLSSLFGGNEQARVLFQQLASLVEGFVNSALAEHERRLHHQGPDGAAEGAKP